MKWQVLCDMDGVVADFQNAAFLANGLPDPYTTPESMGCFDIEKLWGITAKEFWEPIDALGLKFWANLPKMPEADQIIDLLDKRVGIDNVAFLTAPHTSPYCIPGKYLWLEKNYPTLSKRVIFGSAKEFMAAPKRVLLDDRDKNLQAYHNAGGVSVLVPRLWNKGWREAGSVIETIKSQLDEFEVYNER